MLFIMDLFNGCRKYRMNILFFQKRQHFLFAIHNCNRVIHLNVE
jgi:hypothetical protein